MSLHSWSYCQSPPMSRWSRFYSNLDSRERKYVNNTENTNMFLHAFWNEQFRKGLKQPDWIKSVSYCTFSGAVGETSISVSPFILIRNWIRRFNYDCKGLVWVATHSLKDQLWTPHSRNAINPPIDIFIDSNVVLSLSFQDIQNDWT